MEGKLSMRHGFKSGLLFLSSALAIGSASARQIPSRRFVDYANSPAPAAPRAVESFPIDGGKYSVQLDVSQVPELADWARQTLIPVVQDWYPKIIALLPSPKFKPPRHFSITFKKDMQGVANTAGTKITAAGPWYLHHLQDEAVGSIVHEMVHIVQQYDGNPVPGWLVEGLADYIRFYLFEPQVHGARIRPKAAAKVRYDDSYRLTANFLNWVVEQGNTDLILNLNAAMRQGHYNEGLWPKLTGHSLQQLGDAWKQALLHKASHPAPAP
jgi:hypothetical protein